VALVDDDVGKVVFLQIVFEEEIAGFLTAVRVECLIGALNGKVFGYKPSFQDGILQSPPTPAKRAGRL